jgi:predicted oxidoreductase
VLKETIQRFNHDARAGVDRDFGRGLSKLDQAYGDASHTPNPCLGPLAAPPYYAVRVKTGDLGSLVGLRTNRHAEVLDRQGRIIPGLYAAGLDAASAMGGYYPAGGVTVGAAMTFGWIAAMRAINTGNATSNRNGETR